MTQEGVIAQLAVKPTADDPSFICFSNLSTDRKKCFPLSAAVNQSKNTKGLK